MKELSKKEKEELLSEVPVMLPEVEGIDQNEEFISLTEEINYAPIDGYFLCRYGNHQRESRSFNGSYSIDSNKAIVSGMVNYVFSPTGLDPNRSGPFFVEYENNSGLLKIMYDRIRWSFFALDYPEVVTINFDPNNSFSFTLLQAIAVRPGSDVVLVRGSYISV